MRKNIKQVVLVGAGDWAKSTYADALKPYQQRGECKVYIIYDTSYAEKAQGFTQSEKDDYNSHTRENVDNFESWGATCLDLACPKNIVRIKNIVADVVFVVTASNTHCDVVKEWIDRAELIIVEKPFDDDPEKIRQLRRTIVKEDAVRGFDHYLMRANQFKMMREYLHFDDHMEGQIHEFIFHMLESADRGMENRSATIQEGMIMDMGSHTPALVWPFGDPNTIRLDSIKAGVYEPGGGITTSGRTIMKKGMETFAEIHFTFTSIFGQEVQATARVGKCIGSADEKYVEVIGGKKGDRKFRLDLINYIVDFFEGNKITPVSALFDKPVHLMVREIIGGRASESLALFKPEIGQDIVARLNEWRRPIINYVDISRGTILPQYTAKTPWENLTGMLLEL